MPSKLDFVPHPVLFIPEYDYCDRRRSFVVLERTENSATIEYEEGTEEFLDSEKLKMKE